MLGGADFGAGFWQLLAGRGRAGERIREHAHEAMAPVWEANHVWLIFVLVVMWTATRGVRLDRLDARRSRCSSPRVGIILRGTAYALRARHGAARASGARSTRRSRSSSVLTPFALGTVRRRDRRGARAGRQRRRRPVDELAEPVVADDRRARGGARRLPGGGVPGRRRGAARRADELERRSARARWRPASSAGALAVVGLVVLRADARALYDGLMRRRAAGVDRLGARRRRHAGARVGAPLRARALRAPRWRSPPIVAGWALAQQPVLLPGLTVHEAAAPRRHARRRARRRARRARVLLAPSLALLFTLTLRGRLGHEGDARGDGRAGRPRARAERLALRPAGPRRRSPACSLTLGFLTVADAGWAHAIGVATLLAAVLTGFRAAVPVASRPARVAAYGSRVGTQMHTAQSAWPRR